VDFYEKLKDLTFSNKENQPFKLISEDSKRILYILSLEKLVNLNKNKIKIK
jgi:hypothetical protein